MAPALLAAVAILSLAEGQLAYTTGVRTEARRTWTTPQGAQIEALELEVIPSGGLTWTTSDFTARGEYEPRLWSLTDPWKPGIYHRGLASLALVPSRALRLRLELSGAYGDADSTTLAAGATGQARPIGQLTRSLQQDLRAGLAADLTPLPTLLLAASASYGYRGGADTAARLTSPLQQGPHAVLSAAWQADPRNSLTTEATYDWRRQSAAPGGPAAPPPAWSTVLLEAWTTALGPELSARIGAGGALTSGSDGVTPAAELGLTLSQRTGWRFQAGERTASGPCWSGEVRRAAVSAPPAVAVARRGGQQQGGQRGEVGGQAGPEVLLQRAGELADGARLAGRARRQGGRVGVAVGAGELEAEPERAGRDQRQRGQPAVVDAGLPGVRERPEAGLVLAPGGEVAGGPGQAAARDDLELQRLDLGALRHG